jgi:hypothetical protein
MTPDIEQPAKCRELRGGTIQTQHNFLRMYNKPNTIDQISQRGQKNISALVLTFPGKAVTFWSVIGLIRTIRRQRHAGTEINFKNETTKI